MAPRYKHDCDACRYAGNWEGQDLYYCPNCDGGTVVLRYGDDGPDYASLPLDLARKTGHWQALVAFLISTGVINKEVGV